MARVFNPPPNWPQPPKRWKPPPDWQPDPSWGPAPPGWKLWLDESEPEVAARAEAPKEKRIFISYRRSDCQPQANAINDGLRHRLSPAKIFMDIDAIPVGVDFAQHIREEIEICDVVLVLIGDDWLTSTDREGRRRIDDPEDFVRREIENAFASPRVSVIPVLVEGAEMPRAEDLPEGIQRLTRINAIELSDQRWTSDIDRLAREIKRLEEYQEARAKRIFPDAPPAEPETAPAKAPEPPVTPTVPSPMTLANVKPQVISTVVASMADAFYAKDVSGHRYTRHQHGEFAEAPNYHAVIDQYLHANHRALGLAPPEKAINERGTIWRRPLPAVPAPGPGVPRPTDRPQPVVGPVAGSTTSSNAVVGWIMVVIPLVSCGFFSFVPSIWVAYVRRQDSALMSRALMTAGAFLLTVMVAVVLILTAPTDAAGTPSGTQNNVGVAAAFLSGLLATVLALFQRTPEGALARSG